MPETAQTRALRNYRQRLTLRGVTRFEVLGLPEDRDLLRTLARRLSANNHEAATLRETLRRTLAAETTSKGGILAALRRSPLVGADLEIVREKGDGRRVEL